MFSYLIIILVVTILIFFSGNISFSKVKNDKVNLKYSAISIILLLIAGMIFVIFSSFRRIDIGYGGTDAITYKNYFLSVNTNLKEALLIQNYEWGYSFIVWFGRTLTENYSLFLVFIYSFMFFGVIKFLKFSKWNNYNFFVIALMITLLINSFNINRVVLAVVLGLFVYIFLHKDQYIRALLLTIIATTIHISSVILFPCILTVYLMRNQKNISWKKILFWIANFSIVSVAFLKFSSGLISSSKYGIYNQESSIAWPTYLIILFVFTLSLFKYKEMVLTNPFNKTLILILPIALIIAPLQIQFPILYRMLLFFLPVLYTLIPSLIVVLRFKKIDQFYNLIIQLVLVLYLATRLYVFFQTEIYSSGIPYINSLFE